MNGFWKWYLILVAFFTTLRLCFIFSCHCYEYLICALVGDLIIVSGNFKNFFSVIGLLKESKEDRKGFIRWLIFTILVFIWFGVTIYMECVEIVQISGFHFNH